jgi:hypothetical protein
MISEGCVAQRVGDQLAPPDMSSGQISQIAPSVKQRHGCPTEKARIELSCSFDVP